MRKTLLALCGALALLVIETGAAAPPPTVVLGPTTAAFQPSPGTDYYYACGGSSQPACTTVGPYGTFPHSVTAGAVQARFGNAAATDGQTGLGFTATDNPAAALGQNVQLGQLFYVNTAIVGNVATIPLQVTIPFTTKDGPGTFHLVIPFAVDQTTNATPPDCKYPSTTPCADALQFPATIPPVSQTVNGKTYTLTVLGFTKSPTSTVAEPQLVVQENEQDTGYLIGNVTRSNEAPVAVGDNASVSSGGQTSIDVEANDSDADGDAFSPSIVGAPAHGTATVNGDKIDYTAPANFAGTDSFTYIDTDGFGATSNTATVTVTVNDTTKPVLSLPASFSVDETSPTGATVTFPSTPSATDNLDVTDAVTCDHTSGSFFPNGQTTVTCSTHDAAGNTAAGSFTVTVLDTTKPTLHLPTSISVPATSTAGAAVSYTATATDNVDASVTPSCTPSSGSTFPVGQTTVNCSVSDTAGNTATGSFTVTVGSPLDALSLDVNGLKPGNSFPAKAQSIKAYFTAGSTGPACSQLAALVSEAHAQSGKQLTVAQANQLLTLAAAAGTFMGC